MALFAAVRDAPGWETDVVEAATHIPQPIGVVLQAVMQLGTRPGTLAVIVVAWLLARPREMRWRASAAVLVAGGIVVRVTNAALKEVVSRGRPEGVHLRDDSDGFGFPSGHTSVAFAAATVLAAYLPIRWRWLPFVLAGLVGVARMYVGVHYPLDVLGGALWGVTIGWIVLALPPFRPTESERPASDPGL